MGKWEPTRLALIFRYTFAKPSNQTTEKKKENVEYENHTHFKYDSQININHWPTDEKTIRHKQNSS